MESTREALALTVFERLFREFGLPLRIRSDNGVPFCSSHALNGLSLCHYFKVPVGKLMEVSGGTLA